MIKDNHVLHVVVDNDKKKGAEKEYQTILQLADEYEGEIKNRIGVNFPLSSRHPIHKQYIDKYGDVSYLIMYKKGDITTKRHELQHARYYLDAAFREEVKRLWDGLNDRSRSNVLCMLKKMGYPMEKNEIVLDEFQAYYFTEKPNFFALK